MSLRYGSLFSGIEAATQAWHPLGWRPHFFAEIDPFPCAVLATHYPEVPNLGDVTKFERWPDAELDILVGGSPCQAFSIAGLRKGLADPRGDLMLTYLAIARRYRPAWLVWENVPGVLSSNGGRDFGTFLGALEEFGYGFAYRVLDAQFFNLAQRRARVFVVASLAGWRSAAAVLFEPSCLSGDPAPCREAGKEIAGPLAGCSNGGGANGPGRSADDATSLVTHPLRCTWENSEDGTGRGTPIIPVLANTLTARMHKGINTTADEGQTAIPCTAQTINASMYLSGGATAGFNPGVRNCFPTLSGVRRLTPRECERLQGFPDDYTLINYRGKPAKDSPRYKALGNSKAVTVVHWLGSRIDLLRTVRT